MSYYYNKDHTEDNTQYIDQQIEEDQMFEENYETCVEVLSDMRESISDTVSGDLLQFCSPADLMRLIEDGTHTLPKYLQPRPVEQTGDQLLVIPEPVGALDWPEQTPMKFTTLKNQSEMDFEAEQQRQEQIQKVNQQNYIEQMKKYEEQMALERARTASNKFNWTMTKEMRGILPKPVLVEQPKKMSKTQKRRLRKKGSGFKANKSRATRM